MASLFQASQDGPRFDVETDAAAAKTGAPATDLNAVLYDVGQSIRPRDQLRKLLHAALAMAGGQTGAVITDDERGPEVLVHRQCGSWTEAAALLHAPASFKVPLQLGSRRLGWLLLKADRPDQPAVPRHAESTILALAAVAALTLDRMLQGRAAIRSLRRRRDALSVLDASAFLLDDRLDLFRLDGRPGWGGAWSDAAHPATNLDQLLPDAGATVFQEHLKRTLETGKPVAFEFDVPLQAGQRHFAIRMHPLDRRATRPGTALVMTHDISRRQNVDEKRRHRMTQLRRALDSLPMGFLVLEETVDGRRTVSVANRPLDVLLKTPLRIGLGEDGEECLDRLQRCFASGGWMDAMRCQRLDDSRATCHTGKNTLMDGTRIGWQVSRTEKRLGRAATEVWSFFSVEPVGHDHAPLVPEAVARLADCLTVVVGLSEKVKQQALGQDLDPGIVDMLVTAARSAVHSMR